MEFIGFALFGIGFVVVLIGGVMFLIAAFREGALWGLAVFFLPLASLVFLVMYWNQAKKAWFIQLAGAGVMLVGGITLAGASPDSSGVLGSLEEPVSGSEHRSVSPQTTSRPETLRIEEDPVDEFLPTESETEASTVPEIVETESTSSRRSPATSRRSPATSSRPPPAPSSRRSSAGGLSMRSLNDHIGKKLRFTKKSGKIIEGKLIGVDDDRITIEERVGGGRWSFSLAKSSIAKIEPARRR